MRRFKVMGFILGLALVLAACGGLNQAGNPEGTVDPNVTPLPTAAVTFSGDIIGAGLDQRINGDGWFTCLTNAEPPRYELTSGLPQSTIRFSLPADINRGTFTIGGESPINAEVVFDSENSFRENATGTITLDRIANAVDEPVRGNFSFEVSSGSRTVTATGNFNFQTPSISQFCE